MRIKTFWAVGLVLVLGCRSPRPSVHPRQTLFGLEATDPVIDVLARPARLTALYYPDLDSCKPAELSVVRALKSLQSEYEDLRILTVLPDHYGGTVEIYGEEFPGDTITIRSISHREQARVAPIPRVEVWSAAQELLLLRSIPTAITEAGIYNELLWTRSFTAPLDEKASCGG